MDGFKRPVRPANPAPPASSEPSRHTAPIVQQPVVAPTEPERAAAAIDMRLDESAKPVTVAKRRKKWPIVLLGVVLLLIAAVIGAYVWYTTQLQPVDSSNTSVQRVEIKQGSSLSYVAEKLQERGLIRSSLAFSVLANQEGKQNAIQAGTCNLAPAESAREILAKITKGCNDFKSVTFYPGATLEPSLYARAKAAKEGNKNFKDFSIRASLQAAGYSDSEITAAFASSYTGPLFTDRPSGEGLEGYIFGETYYVDTKASAKEVIQVALDHMYDVIKTNDLVTKFKAQGLDLYHGITLASVVQKELDCEGKPTKERKDRCYAYQQQIARVFYNRIQLGMSLGSDVTSIYASDKLGVTSSIDVDSNYNTRKYAGMPPGPIATPGTLALLATATPSTGDELYFLAGDDGLIYFATTEAGHTANIKNHCQVLCGEL